MNINSKAKENVLDKLIEMMDDKMLGDLKGKSPKFAKVDIQSDDPKLAESLKDKLVEGVTEDAMENPMDEMSKADFKEDLAEGENPMKEADHNDEDMQRLLEMYKQLK